jgi:hypothetical protein
MHDRSGVRIQGRHEQERWRVHVRWIHLQHEELLPACEQREVLLQLDCDNDANANSLHKHDRRRHERQAVHLRSCDL